MKVRLSATGVPYLDRDDGAQRRPRGRARAPLAAAALFLAAFALLQVAWSGARGSGLERFVVHRCTVAPAAFLIDTFTPQIGASAAGARIVAPGGGLNVLNGCEGTEAALLLLAALIALPLTWRRRLYGAGLGIALVFALNQMRILALFYAHRSDAALFDLLHGTVAPLAVVALTGLFVLAWAQPGARAHGDGRHD